MTVVERLPRKMTQTKPNEQKPLPRRGWLKNGNPPGDPNTAPRCGAKTRRGTPCQSPAMRNGRCRMHGGASTGPRTPEGLARSRRSRWKHGLYSSESKAEQERVRELVRQSRELLKQL
ncbi:MAG: HGGxSTG domain-containing protein [Thiobacillaceae bacterium]